MNDILSEKDGLRILSLDGGGLNCVSELKILDEFMSRVQYDTRRTVWPCQYFHSITGVGASGVIAILLGVLGLSIDETIVRFLRICNEVSLCEEVSPQIRSQKLLVAAKVMLQELDVSEEARFRGDVNRGEGCKVSIPYLSAVNMTHCRMLRSYDSRHSSYNLTILEAISIAWATPGIFSWVRVGAELMWEDLISAVDGFNNPTLQAIKETHETFGQDQRVSCLLSIGVGRPPIRGLSMDGHGLAQNSTRDTETTVEQLKSRYNNLGIYFRLSVDWNLASADAPAVLEERVAKINAHTSTYLETQDVSKTLEWCVGASNRLSRITLEDLHRTRTKGSRSSRGLPPLSSFFVNRKRPMDEIVNVLKPGAQNGQRVAVVVGMGGSGKTQLSLKYAYDNGNQYDHILFVDASSTESLQNGILNRVRLLTGSSNPTTPNEAIQLLAHSRGDISRKWLMIMDNADNAETPLREFFPPCDFGAILVTTRNVILGNLSPIGLVSLDVMSKEEAIELLLLTALGPSSPGTNREREFAAEIIETLGYLPIAIVQAGCYIKLQKCLPDYVDRLRVHRARLLRKPALAQLDKLKYDHSAYAAFDTTLSVLSPLSLQVLGILSFVHFTDFPCPLFSIAASYGFVYQPIYLSDRPEEYHQSVDLLKAAFCPNGAWEDEILERVLEELQQYSMLTLVPINSIVTLRLHPLIHSWAKDRLSPQEAMILRGAAIRLLVCGTHSDSEYLWVYLLPHLKYISPASHEVHLNDRAALATILRQLGESAELVRIWEDTYDQMRSSLGERHLQTSRVALQLADAYGENDTDRMEQLEREVLNLRYSLLGEQHPETFHAMANLARTLKVLHRYTEASQLQISVLAHSRLAAESNPRGVVQALEDLAATCIAQKQYAEAIVLLKEAIETLAALVGQAHTATIAAMGLLASCCALQGDVTSVRDLKTQMDKLKKQLDVPRYTIVLHHMDSIAYSYFAQAKFAEAESQWKEVLEGRREILGDLHGRTLRTMLSLSNVMHCQGRYAEADALAEKVVEGRRLVYGDVHAETLEAVHIQAGFLEAQERYTESEILRREQYEQVRQAVGELHATTLKELFKLARLLYVQGEHTEAAKLFQKVVEGLRQVRGNSHEDTLDALSWVGYSFYIQFNFVEATKAWKDELMERKQEEYAEAEILRREEWEIRREMQGELDTYTLYALTRLAFAVLKQGRHAECQALLRDLVERRRAAQGDDHPETQRSIQWLHAVTPEHEEVLDEADAHGASVNPIATSLPLVSTPQPQRTFAWFQRFQQTGSIRTDLTSPISSTNETLNVDP